MTVTTLTDGGQDPVTIAEALRDFLAAATTSLDLALYDFHLEPGLEEIVIDTIEAAAARGVAVRVVYNADFHTVVIEACGNVLLSIAAQPIFAVLQTHLARSRLGRPFHRSINEHHREIADAIESGDARAAGESPSSWWSCATSRKATRE